VEQYFDCWAQSQACEKNKIDVETQQLRPATWDKRKHAQAEARCNAIMHTNIEYLIQHCCGEQKVLLAECGHVHALPHVNTQTNKPYFKSYMCNAQWCALPGVLR